MYVCMYVCLYVCMCAYLYTCEFQWFLPEGSVGVYAFMLCVYVCRTKTFLEPSGCRTRQPGRTWLLGPGACSGTNSKHLFCSDYWYKSNKKGVQGSKTRLREASGAVWVIFNDCCLKVCMHVFMYVCAYVCLYVCMYACALCMHFEWFLPEGNVGVHAFILCVYVYMSGFQWLLPDGVYVCMYVCMYVCLYVCMCAYMYACDFQWFLPEGMWACMHLYMYVCVHICVFVRVCVYMYAWM